MLVWGRYVIILYLDARIFQQLGEVDYVLLGE